MLPPKLLNGLLLPTLEKLLKALKKKIAALETEKQTKDDASLEWDELFLWVETGLDGPDDSLSLLRRVAQVWQGWLHEPSKSNVPLEYVRATWEPTGRIFESINISKDDRGSRCFIIISKGKYPANIFLLANEFAK